MSRAIDAELAALYKQHGGLEPAVVVEWARRNPRSALHTRFEWNDSVAAQAYRLWQARELIVTVTAIYPDRKTRQTYVSVMSDRGKVGYTALIDVLSDAERRAEFLAQALAELERIAEKYRDLTELAGVRVSIQNARRRIGRPRRRKVA